MNISGIRPISSSYTNYSGSFGAYDVNTLRKPEVSALKVDKATSVHSRAQIEKAVDTMKRDASLHRYQKFVTERPVPSQPGRDVMENFTL